MENKITEKNQIRHIVNKFEKLDSAVRNSFFIILLLLGVVSIIQSFYESSMPIFVIIPGILIGIELIILFIWLEKKGYLHILKLNKLVEEVFGKINDKDREIAQQLLERSKYFIPKAKLLLKRCKIRSFIKVIAIKGEVNQALQSITYGIRWERGEAEILLTKLNKHSEIIFDTNLEKDKIDNFIAQIADMFNRTSFQLA